MKYNGSERFLIKYLRVNNKCIGSLLPQSLLLGQDDERSIVLGKIQKDHFSLLIKELPASFLKESPAHWYINNISLTAKQPQVFQLLRPRDAFKIQGFIAFNHGYYCKFPGTLEFNIGETKRQLPAVKSVELNRQDLSANTQISPSHPQGCPPQGDQSILKTPELLTIKDLVTRMEKLTLWLHVCNQSQRCPLCDPFFILTFKKKKKSHPGAKI